MHAARGVSGRSLDNMRLLPPCLCGFPGVPAPLGGPFQPGLPYGRTNRLVDIASGTALRYRSGVPPVPIRWLLVRDLKGELEPQAFLATNLNARPCDILAWFVSRWQVGVSSEGHAVMSVKVRPELKNSGFEAREAPWRESKTAEPSDNMLERSMREASGCNVQ